MKSVTAEVPDGRYSLWGVAIYAGRDISATICGGELDHIGAVATGIARPSLEDATKCSASTSVLCITGHKEDDLAKKAAGRLAAMYGCVANVCVGIHIDDAGVEDIRRLVANFDQLFNLLVQQIEQSGPPLEVVVLIPSF